MRILTKKGIADAQADGPWTAGIAEVREIAA
jgi:hypothetical protein